MSVHLSCKRELLLTRSCPALVLKLWLPSARSICVCGTSRRMQQPRHSDLVTPVEDMPSLHETCVIQHKAISLIASLCLHNRSGLHRSCTPDTRDNDGRDIVAIIVIYPRVYKSIQECGRRHLFLACSCEPLLAESHQRGNETGNMSMNEPGLDVKKTRLTRRCPEFRR